MSKVPNPEMLRTHVQATAYSLSVKTVISPSLRANKWFSFFFFFCLGSPVMAIGWLVKLNLNSLMKFLIS